MMGNEIKSLSLEKLSDGEAVILARDSAGSVIGWWCAMAVGLMCRFLDVCRSPTKLDKWSIDDDSRIDGPAHLGAKLATRKHYSLIDVRRDLGARYQNHNAAKIVDTIIECGIGHADVSLPEVATEEGTEDPAVGSDTSSETTTETTTEAETESEPSNMESEEPTPRAA